MSLLPPLNYFSQSKKLILRCMSWCDLVLTFHLSIVTLVFEILYSYISETIRYRKLIFGWNICWWVQVCKVIILP